MMNKPKLIMVDFWSHTDKNGKPVGHGIKVGNEYYDYVKDDFDVIQYVNESMMPWLKNKKGKSFSTSVDYNMSKRERVCRSIKSIREVYKNGYGDSIWFYVPDIYLFLYIILHRKNNRKLIVTVYEEYLTNSVKHWIFMKALKKIDLVFVTNQSLLKDIPLGVLIPDYAYDEELYGRYQSGEKRNQVVCLGTMNEKKLLKETVTCFNNNGYRLYLAGQFETGKKYEELKKIANENIVVENRYVDNEEYYRILSESKYCIIPYDAEFYKNRTSGVIQECLFCDCIPVAPESILQFSGVDGIGYSDISEIEEINFDQIDTEKFYNSYRYLREKYYRKDKVRDTVISSIKNICR